ncbi:MAG: hypothetical protein VX000_16250, partial [Myxococcota bacterium]|nr:hypothetical protein [Myxococcota bacterium]
MLHALVSLFAITAPAAAGPVLQPVPLSEESYAETYTAVAAMDDGSFVLLQLLFTNAGFGDRKGACRALWVPPGGTGINASTSVDKGDWAYDSASDALTVGPCRLGTSGGGLQFVARLDGLSVTLDLDGRADSTRPPDHRIASGDAFHESDIVVARADARAVVKAGGRTLEQKGAAHLDHSRSTTLLPRIARCWVRFRGFEGGSPALLQVRLPPKGGAARAWSWALSESTPTAGPTSNVQLRSGNDGTPQLTVGPYTVEAGNAIYRYRPTESYGAVGKLAAP